MKPDNFLIEGKDEEKHLVVTDFGFTTELILNQSLKIHHGWTSEMWGRREIMSPLTEDPKLLESFATYLNLCQLFYSFRDEYVRWNVGNDRVVYETFVLPKDPNFGKLTGLYPWLWFPAEGENAYVIG
jgi:hypothetical protein